MEAVPDNTVKSCLGQNNSYIPIAQCGGGAETFSISHSLIARRRRFTFGVFAVRALKPDRFSLFFNFATVVKEPDGDDDASLARNLHVQRNAHYGDADKSQSFVYTAAGTLSVVRVICIRTCSDESDFPLIVSSNGILFTRW